MDPRHTTLREMGLRTAKSIALHLLQENTYESNLVSDIANAPYLRGNAGRTHLAAIPGFPPFVDDIYLYGRLRERDTVRVGNRVSCTTGEHGSAARIVSQISIFVRGVWPPVEHKHIPVSIANTVAVGSGTRIPQTIQGIEERDEGRLASTWQRLHGGDRAAAYFVAKLDVSELPIAALHAGLPALQRLLVANGMSLYQVDYTQDFSGTLDRKALVQHLEKAHRFAYQGQAPPQNAQGCIVDNTSSVGNHVCTFVWSTGTRAVSTKFYNKLVAQIEAGDVRGTFGGHMSGLVASTNQHLRQTLAHPDVLARGCTRLEISIYGCLVEELDEAKAKKYGQQPWSTSMCSMVGVYVRCCLYNCHPLVVLSLQPKTPRRYPLRLLRGCSILEGLFYHAFQQKGLRTRACILGRLGPMAPAYNISWIPFLGLCGATGLAVAVADLCRAGVALFGFVGGGGSTRLSFACSFAPFGTGCKKSVPTNARSLTLMPSVGTGEQNIACWSLRLN